MKTIYQRGGQGVNFNIIGIDNTKNSFKSAAEAYNDALKETKGDCLIFCHQDVLFLEDSLYNIASNCIQYPTTLWGAAGVREAGVVISNMAVIQEGWKYGTLKPGENDKVQTIDECMIAASRSFFEEYRFDENTCDGWHLYAVDLSLQCYLKNNEVRVLDANIVHISTGNTDKTFWECLEKLAKKYCKKIRKINTTCSWTYTNPFLFKVLNLYRKLKYKNN